MSGMASSRVSAWRKDTGLRRDSMSVSDRPGSTMRRGAPGMPAPAPMSRTGGGARGRGEGGKARGRWDGEAAGGRPRQERPEEQRVEKESPPDLRSRLERGEVM